jgi:activating signal cointegrator complex subunit 2
MDRQDPNTVLRDRSFIDEMKADILRRAQAMSDEENENPTGVDFAYDEELEAGGLGGVKVAGDGDDESGWEDDRDGGDEDGGGGGGSGPPHRPNPETILELAYIRDPKLFERDAQTRRGKPRTELKSQTGSSTFIQTLGAPFKFSFSKVGLMYRLKGGKSCWNVM